MGKSTISMAIFHCYVSSPEGIVSHARHMVKLGAPLAAAEAHHIQLDDPAAPCAVCAFVWANLSPEGMTSAGARRLGCELPAPGLRMPSLGMDRGSQGRTGVPWISFQGRALRPFSSLQLVVWEVAPKLVRDKRWITLSAASEGSEGVVERSTLWWTNIAMENHHF